MITLYFGQQIQECMWWGNVSPDHRSQAIYFQLSISIYLFRFASSWQSKRNSIKPNNAGHVKAASH